MLYSIIITDSPKEIEHGFSTSNYFIQVPTSNTAEHLDYIKPISQPFTNIISLYDGERIGERVIPTDDNPSLRLNPIPTLQISRDYAEDLESCMFNESSSPANLSPKSKIKFRKFSSISGRIGNLWNRLSMHASSSSNPNNNRCPLLVEPE